MKKNHSTRNRRGFKSCKLCGQVSTVEHFKQCIPFKYISDIQMNKQVLYQIACKQAIEPQIIDWIPQTVPQDQRQGLNIVYDDPVQLKKRVKIHLQNLTRSGQYLVYDHQQNNREFTLFKCIRKAFKCWIETGSVLYKINNKPVGIQNYPILTVMFHRGNHLRQADGQARQFIQRRYGSYDPNKKKVRVRNQNQIIAFKKISYIDGNQFTQFVWTRKSAIIEPPKLYSQYEQQVLIQTNTLNNMRQYIIDKQNQTLEKFYEKKEEMEVQSPKLQIQEQQMDEQIVQNQIILPKQIKQYAQSDSESLQIEDMVRSPCKFAFNFLERLLDYVVKGNISGKDVWRIESTRMDFWWDIQMLHQILRPQYRPLFNNIQPLLLLISNNQIKNLRQWIRSLVYRGNRMKSIHYFILSIMQVAYKRNIKQGRKADNRLRILHQNQLMISRLYYKVNGRMQKWQTKVIYEQLDRIEQQNFRNQIKRTCRQYSKYISEQQQ